MRSERVRTGAASIFVVIFTTLLLSLISLGFVSIMLSEANQTINYDLSQSAYDSALAGIEDAKVALLKYHDCLSRRDFTSDACVTAIRPMQNPAEAGCDIVPMMLGRPYRDEDGKLLGETIIQTEDGNLAIGDGTAVLEQAYTCVKMVENTDDYLGRLNANYRTKVIPLRAEGNFNHVRLSWYSAEDVWRNRGGYYAGLRGSYDFPRNKMGFSSTTLYAGSSIFGERTMEPPVLQFQLIQTAATFNLAEFNTNQMTRSNRGTLLLRPVGVLGDPGYVNLIDNVADKGLATSADRSFNNPIDINCRKADFAYQCSTEIVLPDPIGGARADTNAFVRLTLPYAAPDTSFSLELLNCGGSGCVPVNFVGVQARIDSTGRANDLFRRVEARVELVDVYYPYPEFTVDMHGEDDNSIRKNFWVTLNCWMSDFSAAPTKCSNSGYIGGM